jgi:hypothetical protein
MLDKMKVHTGGVDVRKMYLEHYARINRVHSLEVHRSGDDCYAELLTATGDDFEHIEDRRMVWHWQQRAEAQVKAGDLTLTIIKEDDVTVYLYETPMGQAMREALTTLSNPGYLLLTRLQVPQLTAGPIVEKAPKVKRTIRSIETGRFLFEGTSLKGGAVYCWDETHNFTIEATASRYRWMMGQVAKGLATLHLQLYGEDKLVVIVRRHGWSSMYRFLGR